MWSPEAVGLMLGMGALAGLIAGLFGIGGGMILVPVVLWVLQIQGDAGSAHAQHLAVGTSFAVMVFTSFASAYAQYRKQAIEWPVFRSMAPGMILGVAAGAQMARYLPNSGMQIFFACFAAVLALRTLLGIRPSNMRSLPGRRTLFGMGGLFGILSSWVGIGGGSLVIPYLSACHVSMHRTVATSAALGWPIALTGALGYWLAGLTSGAVLPEGSAGFIYLPAVLVLSAATVLFAPIGVRLAHKLPAGRLKTGFGILLLLIAAKMLWQVFR
ncbi:sulfite exporter TauE/SafE family protein [Neisseria leonii]|uniref:Probable membrane transporter protein n=1 Tax=Neisseria leonii TaxID=2995413 RepID=A0A9X4E026_9NEIS|nr:sulfite exporter TauE/SafE family protein [Neisseria sp. 51.81]MDD9327018.1 sulfite exporter TauE/SafE family protein [Neisseria sp. 51.81]